MVNLYTIVSIVLFEKWNVCNTEIGIWLNIKFDMTVTGDAKSTEQKDHKWVANGVKKKILSNVLVETI